MSSKETFTRPTMNAMDKFGLPDDAGEIEVKVEYIVSGASTFGNWKAAESCADMIGEERKT